MEYRRLGKAGLKVSEFSFGAWVTFAKQLDVNAAAKLLGVAFDAGVNFFDNAEGYERGRAEEVMGAALKQLNRPRDTYAVSTKVYWGGDGPMNRGLNRSTSPTPVTPASSGCRSITSISISAIGPTSTRRSRRRCGRCTTSSPRAR